MSQPRTRAITESGTQWDDPSEDLLFELLSDLERGDEEFFIVERPSDDSGQTYAQVILTPDRQFQLEHRDGSADQHFQAFTGDKRAAHRVLTGWSLGLPGWQDELTWERWTG